jgi:diguanylate cyclase (GGDEF)-like protein
LPHTLTSFGASKPGKGRVRRIARILPHLCICLFALGLHAQTGTQMNATPFVLSAMTAKTGLPEGAVLALAQSSDGYLWFGTQEGLVRYDGVSLTVFTTDTDKGLGNDIIFSLVPGPNGSLWIGTLSGVSHYEDGVFHRVFDTTAPVVRLLRDRGGTIWAGTAGAGLYSVEHGRVVAYAARDVLAGKFVFNLAQTPDGTLWIGTDQGLVYSRGAGFHRYGAKDGPFGGHIFGLATAPGGALWVANPEALYRIADGQVTRAPFPPMPARALVSRIFADRQGGLWLLYNHDGIVLLRNGQWTRYTTDNGLPANDALTADEDGGGDVWIGTLRGAAELRQGIFSRFGTAEGLSEDNVWTVLQARDGSLWVGTNSKGLDRIARDGRVRVYDARDGLPAGAIYSLAETDPGSRPGSLWIGQEHGELSRLAQGRITTFHDPANEGQNMDAILPDRSPGPHPGGPQADGLLLGEYIKNGVVSFSNGHFRHIPMPGHVNALARAPDGSVWVGTDHGGLSHITDGVVKTYTTRDGLSSNFIISVYVDRQGVAWAGTLGNGLNRLQNGHITTYGPAQGLFDSTVGGIGEDDYGYLWFTSERGIYKVRRQELNLLAEGQVSSVHSTTYGLEDGLTTLDCNFRPNPSVWKGVGGRLYFTTSDGIVSVDPAHSRVSRPVKPLLIERVLVNQAPRLFRDGLRLAPGATDLEIRYTSPELVDSHRLHFRYRLFGFDPQWIDVGGRRTAYYTHLPPGPYTFEVEAAKGTDDWSPVPARLRILLLPHFWQTDWFRALSAVLLLLAGGVVYRLRLRYLVAHNRELEQKVHERTGELEQAVHSLTSAQAALYEQATRDSLTRLWNRQSIFEKLAIEHARAQAESSSSRASAPISAPSHGLCLVMADIDHFKSINDTYGHQTGDLVLQEVATRLNRLTREGEFAGRYGGEEFILIFPNCSRENAVRRAEELRRAIAETPVQMETGPLSTTCSFGVSTVCPGVTVAALVQQADAALYEAKRSGRNRVIASECAAPEI